LVYLTLFLLGEGRGRVRSIGLFNPIPAGGGKGEGQSPMVFYNA